MIATEMRFVRLALAGDKVADRADDVRYFKDNESAVNSVCRWNAQTAIGATPQWFYAICGLRRVRLAGPGFMTEGDGQIAGIVTAVYAT